MLQKIRKTDLPLSRHVPITSRDTKEERVVLCEDLRCCDGEISLGRCVHFGEDILR